MQLQEKLLIIWASFLILGVLILWIYSHIYVLMKKYYFQVSNIKGDNGGFFDSDCGEFCPQHCDGTWKTWKTVDDPWEKDSTLTVNKQGNEGSNYCIPPVVQLYVSHIMPNY